MVCSAWDPFPESTCPRVLGVVQGGARGFPAPCVRTARACLCAAAGPGLGQAGRAGLFLLQRATVWSGHVPPAAQQAASARPCSGVRPGRVPTCPAPRCRSRECPAGAATARSSDVAPGRPTSAPAGPEGETRPGSNVSPRLTGGTTPFLGLFGPGNLVGKEGGVLDLENERWLQAKRGRVAAVAEELLRSASGSGPAFPFTFAQEEALPGSEGHRGGVTCPWGPSASDLDQAREAGSGDQGARPASCRPPDPWCSDSSRPVGRGIHRKVGTRRGAATPPSGR